MLTDNLTPIPRATIYSRLLDSAAYANNGSTSTARCLGILAATGLVVAGETVLGLTVGTGVSQNTLDVDAFKATVEIVVDWFKAQSISTSIVIGIFVVALLAFQFTGIFAIAEHLFPTKKSETAPQNMSEQQEFTAEDRDYDFSSLIP